MQFSHHKVCLAHNHLSAAGGFYRYVKPFWWLLLNEGFTFLLVCKVTTAPSYITISFNVKMLEKLFKVQQKILCERRANLFNWEGAKFQQIMIKTVRSAVAITTSRFLNVLEILILLQLLIGV